MKLKSLIGKIIDKLELNTQSDEFTITFTDGLYIKFGAEGDCCSHSWIEHLEAPNDVQGAIILDVSDGGSVAWDNHECEEGKNEWGYIAHTCGHDCLRVYNTRFDTDKGSVILEYRNDSNGYYGGNLTLIDTNLPKDSDYDWGWNYVSY
jgi:hypothetical protein